MSKSSRTLLVGAIALLLTVVVGGFGAARADTGTTPVTIGDTPADQVRIVSVDTSAFPSVTATIALPFVTRNVDESAHLSVWSSNTPLEASAARVPGDAQALVLLLDTASGTAPETLAAEQGAAAELILQLDPALPVVVGSSTSEVLSGPTAGSRDALAAVGQFQVGGTRNWTHALDTALRATDPMTRVAVIVLSAGADQVEPFPPGIPVRMSRASGRTYWLALSPNAQPGGALAPIPSTIVAPGTLLARLDSVAADLTAQYRVRFRVDANTAEATITLDSGGNVWTAAVPIRTTAAQATPPVAPPAGASTNRTLPPYRSPLVAVVSSIGNFVDAHWLVLTGVIAALGLGALALSAVGKRGRASGRRALRRTPDRVIDIREDEPTTRRVSSRSK